MGTDREIKRAVDSMVIIVDTREQETEQLAQRLATLGHQYRREALDAADYMVEYQTAEGTTVRLPVAVERKMSLDELATCFTSERERFHNEMERLLKAGVKTYLLVEKASWEKIQKKDYRSQMPVASFIASLLWWSVHYDFKVIFCKSSTSGWLIGKILQYEVCEDARRRKNDSHQG